VAAAMLANSRTPSADAAGRIHEFSLLECGCCSSLAISGGDPKTGRQRTSSRREIHPWWVTLKLWQVKSQRGKMIWVSLEKSRNDGSSVRCSSV